jgi:hypothetical protein
MICKIWGFHGSDYEECHLLGYKTQILRSQETHYVSATEPSQLMLCRNWGFDGGGYEECRLLGYKNSIQILQETQYFSATEPSQLMLRKIWCFHYEDAVLWNVRPYAVRGMLWLLVTAKIVKLADSCLPHDWGYIFLHNVGSYKSHTT